jgi:hypothetical protein
MMAGQLPLWKGAGKPTEVTSAAISECGTYRYRLDRVWDACRPRAVFIMLNPSTADEINEDPTSRRCRNFAKREGYGGLTVVNLYGLRATNPAELAQHPDPVGPENLAHIRLMLAENPGLVIAAWGAQRFAVDQAAEVIDLMSKRIDRRHIMCLGTTKDGHPRHPLYVRADAPLVPLPALPPGAA